MINTSAITTRNTRCKTVSSIFSGEVEVLCVTNPICDVIIKDKEVTCSVVTRAEAVRQKRKISNDNVTSDSFKITQGEDPILKAFFDKAQQTLCTDQTKNPYFMKGVCRIDTFREEHI